MPLKSKAQWKWMVINDKKMFDKFQKESPVSYDSLPDKVEEDAEAEERYPIPKIPGVTPELIKKSKQAGYNSYFHNQMARYAVNDGHFSDMLWKEFPDYKNEYWPAVEAAWMQGRRMALLGKKVNESSRLNDTACENFYGMLAQGGEWAKVATLGMKKLTKEEKDQVRSYIESRNPGLMQEYQYLFENQIKFNEKINPVCPFCHEPLESAIEDGQVIYACSNKECVEKMMNEIPEYSGLVIESTAPHQYDDRKLVYTGKYGYVYQFTRNLEINKGDYTVIGKNDQFYSRFPVDKFEIAKEMVDGPYSPLEVPSNGAIRRSKDDSMEEATSQGLPGTTSKLKQKNETIGGLKISVVEKRWQGSFVGWNIKAEIDGQVVWSKFNNGSSLNNPFSVDEALERAKELFNKKDESIREAEEEKQTPIDTAELGVISRKNLDKLMSDEMIHSYFSIPDNFDRFVLDINSFFTLKDTAQTVNSLNEYLDNKNYGEKTIARTVEILSMSDEDRAAEKEAAKPEDQKKEDFNMNMVAGEVKKVKESYKYGDQVRINKPSSVYNQKKGVFLQYDENNMPVIDMDSGELLTLDSKYLMLEHSSTIRVNPFKPGLPDFVQPNKKRVTPIEPTPPKKNAPDEYVSSKKEEKVQIINKLGKLIEKETDPEKIFELANRSLDIYTKADK